ncbi:hypothetical protein TWF694_006208 [Orbilia ellipsospora]|uniref:Rhodopsin domain-containing protein n=1 Tax=Orbilia ellipsospora TaxID=2528407 RepID=A0AAV9XJF4_9PEZI
MWTPGTPNTRCIGPNISYFLIAFGLAVDLAIFVIPAILVIRISITPQKKLQSIAMFAMGAAGCIIESLRFNQVYRLDTSPDLTYNLGVVNIFIFLQIILGMLCCCAPAARLMIIWIIDTKLKRTMSTTQLRLSVGDTNASTGNQSIYWQSVRDDVESAPGHPSKQISKLPKDLGQSYDSENIEMAKRESVIDGEAMVRVGERIMDPREIASIK